MQGIWYKDYDGNVFSFDGILAHFDSLVKHAKQQVSLIYSPESKSVEIILFETHESFVFEEIEGRLQ